MWKAFYSGNELLAFPLFTMLLFVAIFAAVVVRVVRPKDGGKALDRDALLPLDDGPRPAAADRTA